MGFLPLGAGAGFLADKQFVVRSIRLFLVSFLSLLLYLPWALWFHVEHGDLSLVEHQRGYFQGMKGIPSNWGEYLHDMDIVAFPSLGIGLIAFMLANRRGKGGGLLALSILGLIASAVEFGLALDRMDTGGFFGRFAG